MAPETHTAAVFAEAARLIGDLPDYTVPSVAVLLAIFGAYAVAEIATRRM